MNTLSPLSPPAFTTGSDAGISARSIRYDASLPPDTAGPVHDIDLNNPWIHQVMLGCLRDLAGCPAPTLPELAFRLLQQRLLNGI